MIGIDNIKNNLLNVYMSDDFSGSYKIQVRLGCGEIRNLLTIKSIYRLTDNEYIELERNINIFKLELI